MLAEMLEAVAAPLPNEQHIPIKVEPIDSVCKSIHHGGGGSCTFGHCLGKFFAVVPHGLIYPCQRLAGVEAFRLGNVLDHGGQPAVENSPAWEMLARREQSVDQTCSGCDFLTLCRGGCPYNALSAGAGTFKNGYRDPYCKAYNRLFYEVIERAAEEFFSPENLSLVVNQPDEGKNPLRCGGVLSLMTGQKQASRKTPGWVCEPGN